MRIKYHLYWQLMAICWIKYNLLKVSSVHRRHHDSCCRKNRLTKMTAFLNSSYSSNHLRFVQTRSKLDLMVFMTNIFFPMQDPPEYKELFTRGGCPRWLMNPPYGNNLPPRQLSIDWLPSPGWSYDLYNNIIIYNSINEAREAPHAFPFNLFLPRRISTRYALIKKDFFCQNTQIQSSILIKGAKEGGIIFRCIGERNFWLILLNKGGNIQLIRVKNGEKQILGTIGTIIVQPDKWYTINVQEQIGDVVVTVGIEGEEPIRYTRQQENMEESRPKGYEDSQGAAGLFAGGGLCKFRGTFLGDVNWVPQVQQPKISKELKEATTALGKDGAIISELPVHLRNWCPEGSLCAGPPFAEP